MLFTYATIITVNPSREIIVDGAILVEKNLIAAIGKTDDLKEKYPHEEGVDLTGRIVIPGLISTHAYGADVDSRYVAPTGCSGLLTYCRRLPMISSLFRGFASESGYFTATILRKMPKRRSV